MYHTFMNKIAAISILPLSLSLTEANDSEYFLDRSSNIAFARHPPTSSSACELVSNPESSSLFWPGNSGSTITSPLSFMPIPNCPTRLPLDNMKKRKYFYSGIPHRYYNLGLTSLYLDLGMRIGQAGLQGPMA